MPLQSVQIDDDEWTATDVRLPQGDRNTVPTNGSVEKIAHLFSKQTDDFSLIAQVNPSSNDWMANIEFSVQPESFAIEGQFDGPCDYCRDDWGGFMRTRPGSYILHFYPDMTGVHGLSNLGGHFVGTSFRHIAADYEYGIAKAHGKEIVLTVTRNGEWVATERVPIRVWINGYYQEEMVMP